MPGRTKWRRIRRSGLLKRRVALALFESDPVAMYFALRLETEGEKLVSVDLIITIQLS